MNKTVIILLICLQIYQLHALYDDSKYIIQLETSTFKEVVLQSEIPWYINFGNDNCHRCRGLIKEYEKAAKYMEGKIKFGFVDTQNHPEIKQFWNIKQENTIIFLGADKPEPTGGHVVYNKKFLTEELDIFADKEETQNKITKIYSQGAKNLRILWNKDDLDKYVMESPDPWFLMFCSKENPEKCNDALRQEYQASINLNGICKFAYIDIEKTLDIVNHFGVRGHGIVIFLNKIKPPPYGSPSMVSGTSSLEYEKFAWQTVEVTLLEEEEFQPKLEDLSVLNQDFEKGVMQSDGQAYFILFYSNSQLYAKTNLYKMYSQVMLETEKQLDEESKQKIKFYRYNVDNNRGLIDYLNVWPVPHAFYFPLKWKGMDSIQGYDQEFKGDVMLDWIHKQLKNDQENNFITLTRTNVFETLMQSEEPWFVIFHTHNRMFCDKCRIIYPVFKDLANQESIKGKVNIAAFNCDQAIRLCFQLGMTGYPRFYYFPQSQGPKDLKVKEEYRGVIDVETLAQWTHDQYLIASVKDIVEIKTENDYHQYCSNFNGFCFIILMSPGKTDFNQNYDLIARVSNDFKEKAVSFSWMVGGENEEFEKSFRQIKQAGYPCILGINYKKDQQKGYKVHTGKFDYEELKQFVNSLLTAERAFIPLKKDVVFQNKNQEQKKSDL